MTYPCAKFYGGGSGGINIGTDGTYAMIATDTSGADMQLLTRVAGVFYPRITITSGGTIALNGSSDVTNVNERFTMGYFVGNYGWLQTWDSKPLYFNKLGNAVYAGTQRIDNNSDARIKDNIESISGALDTILSLKGRKFNMLDENGKLRYGFVAQEVQPYLNDFVTESDRTFEKDDVKIENLLTLESSGASWAAFLVEAIKEQQAQIKELKKEIEILKNK
jgi:hypothetical protein